MSRARHGKPRVGSGIGLLMDYFCSSFLCGRTGKMISTGSSRIFSRMFKSLVPIAEGERNVTSGFSRSPETLIGTEMA